MHLTGPNVTLRYLEPSDTQALMVAADDEQQMRFMRFGPFSSDYEALLWIDEKTRERDEGQRLLFAIMVGDKIAGTIDLSMVAVGRSNVTTWLAREFWGTGVNDEAKQLLAFLAFDYLNISRIGAGVAASNPYSQRALARCGYTLEGVFGAWFRLDGAEQDGVMYGLLARDWQRPEWEPTVTGTPPAAFVLEPRPERVVRAAVLESSPELLVHADDLRATS